MHIVIDGTAYLVLQSHFTPLICVAEAREHGMVRLKEIDGERFTAFRNHSPGELHLVMDGDQYVILSTDYRNNPIWFRINPTPSFERRVEYRTASCGWKGFALYGDVQFVVPELFVTQFRAPWR